VTSDRASVKTEGFDAKSRFAVGGRAGPPRPLARWYRARSSRKMPLAGAKAGPAIVIDPGHGGGRFSGRPLRPTATKEKAGVVLAVAHRLREKTGAARALSRG